MPIQGAGSGIQKKAPAPYHWDPTGDATLHSTFIPATDTQTTPTSYGPSGPTGGGTPAPPPPGPPGSVNVKGFNPDYNALLLQDPAYLAWANAHPGVVAGAGAQRAAALRALAMQYGGIPTGFQDTYGDLTPEDIAAAQSNPYSDMHMLQQQYDQNVEQMKKGLAARGALHSGDLGYGQGQLDTQLGQSQYNLGNQFGSNFQNAIQNYLDALTNDRTAQGAAIGQAYQDVIGNPLYAPTPDTTANLVPTWQSDYGQPVYSTSDGRLYTVDAQGNPVLYTG